MRNFYLRFSSAAQKCRISSLLTINYQPCDPEVYSLVSNLWKDEIHNDTYQYGVVHEAWPRKNFKSWSSWFTSLPLVSRELSQLCRERKRQRHKSRNWLVEWGKISVLHVWHALEKIPCCPLQHNNVKLGPVHTKTIVNANACKRKLFYAFRPSVHTKTMKTLTVKA